MWIKFLIVLLEIGFGITFNIVGTISLSELALIITALWYIKRDMFVKYPILKTITWLYAGLLVSQVIAEYMVGNVLNNALKGFAVTTVSYLHFMFLFRYFVKDRKLIIYALIGMLAQSFIFGTTFEGNVDEVLEGQGAVFLKFYLAPLIINIVLLVAIYSKKRNISILCIVTGVLFVVLGARSSGISILLTGFIAYFILFARGKINRRIIIVITLFVAIFGYGLYAVYVNNVLSGKITAGNSLQLKQTSNPYNPINLLMMGRSEAFVGWIAFMDKPLFGHGAWAEDIGGKYHLLQANLTNSIYRDPELNIIPAHSVIIGAGMQNGIFAFAFMVSIFIFFIKNGIKSIQKKDPFLIIILYLIISLIWNGLFSPVSHFRLDMPLAFAFLLASGILNERRKIYFNRVMKKKKLEIVDLSNGTNKI